jgi:hypothetical protein
MRLADLSTPGEAAAVVQASARPASGRVGRSIWPCLLAFHGVRPRGADSAFFEGGGHPGHGDGLEAVNQD